MPGAPRGHAAARRQRRQTERERDAHKHRRQRAHRQPRARLPDAAPRQACTSRRADGQEQEQQQERRAGGSRQRASPAKAAKHAARPTQRPSLPAAHAHAGRRPETLSRRECAPPRARARRVGVRPHRASVRGAAANPAAAAPSASTHTRPPPPFVVLAVEHASSSFITAAP